MSTVKRRRYKRYDIKLAATLVVNNAGFTQCMIRDFCSGGMFLELLSCKGIEALMPQQQIKVLFSVGLEHGGEKFSLDAKIMHIGAKGMGVAFENKSEVAAYEALKKAAQNSLGLTSGDRRSNPTNLSKQKSLEVDLNSLLQKSLPVIIRSFYQRTETKLTAAALRVENLPYSNALLDAITNLKLNKKALFDNFCATKQEARHLTLTTSDQAEEGDTEYPLSLVEKNDFEDWLNLSVIIRNLEAMYESELEQLQKKMALIMGVDKNEVINPACPTKLCDCFRDTLNPIEENSQVKRTLYSIFEETLLELLPDLYKKIDAILLRHGAPKTIVEVSSWKKNKQGTSTTDPGDGVTDTDFSHTEQTIDVSPHHPDISDKTLLSTQPSVSAQESGSVASVASYLLHLIQGHKFPQHNLAIKETGSQAYSAEEISSALSHLQQNTTNHGDLQHVPEVLQKELLHTLDSFSSSHKHLSSTDKNNLDVYECLFETLYNDMLLNKDMQSYLQRIHLPIMDQAMKDPGFLESNSHPARNIVNHLSWLESAVKDNKIVKNTHIRQTLDHLMEKITQESLDNTTVFNTVEQQLNEITESVSKSIDNKIKRVTEIYEGKQKLEKARQTVQKSINRGLAGKKIPKIIVTLLEAGWQHLLVIAKLKEDNQSLQNYLGIINHLNGWLTGRKKASKKQANTALEFIDTHLQSVCTNTFLHSNIMRELNALLLGENIQPGSDAMEMINFEIHEETRIAGKAKRRLEEVDQLRVGEWLTFLLEQELEPLKLVWISETQEVFVFVDRNGLKRQELEREDLAELIRSGAANRIESLDEPIMNRATNLMLQHMHEKLVFNATHDPVTKLFNRKEFIKQLKQELTKLDDTQHALFNIEVLDFRIITNACGLTGGDALLAQLANLLKSQLSEEEIIARLDDKTFSILLKNCPTEAVENMGQKVLSRLMSSVFEWQDKSYAIAVSMGIVPLFFDNKCDVNNVLQKADSVTLSAKEAGRNRIQIYKDDDETLKSQYNVHEWAGRINQVFTDNRLFLRCQKIASIDPEKGRHTHYEILLGIKDENDNVIAPDDFIPAVERCRRMSEVDRWVVQSVFTWIEQHEFDFEMLDGFSINLSGESMNSEEFLDFLKDTIEISNVPLEKITFEITETVAADSFLFVQKFIKQIKRYNCKFSLDDFGSGYSSYSYLKSLDVDYLKIDGVFVKDILNNSTDVAIVKSMNEIAHSLKLETIAEYVENDEIHAVLKDIGVDYAQGWGIQKPILLSDLA